MKIATVVLTHGNLELTRDTVEAIETNVGDRIIVLVDKVGWGKFQNIKFKKAKIVEGLHHAYHKGPYRNYALGLKLLHQHFPDSDWFLYSEYDVLFASDAFKKDLEKAKNKRAYCVGFDLRKFDFETPLLSKIIEGVITKSYYFLGCCQFHSGDFISKLAKMNFFDDFLVATEKFEKGYFEGYRRYAFEEELWATLAAYFGGNLYELCCWKKGDQQEHQSIKISDPRMIYAGKEHDGWRGRFKLYPVRNSPEIEKEDMFPEASIVHPIKNNDSAIRAMYKNKRRLTKKKAMTLL